MEKEELALFSVLSYYNQVVSAILQLKIASNPKGSRTQHFSKLRVVCTLYVLSKLGKVFGDTYFGVVCLNLDHREN